MIFREYTIISRVLHMFSTHAVNYMATIIIFRTSHAQKIKMESLFGQKEKVKKFLALSMCNTYVLPSRHQLHDQIQPMLGTCALYIYNSTVGG